MDHGGNTSARDEVGHGCLKVCPKRIVLPFCHVGLLKGGGDHTPLQAHL